jgi:dihydroorotate dehydrogenase (fumarate)
MSVDLTTDYLGFELSNPLICGASPLVNEPETVRRLAEAGVSAFVLYSLFEEDIEKELSLQEQMHGHEESHAEALSYFPEPSGWHQGPQGYLELIRRTKQEVSVPVIASLNGASPGGWTGYAREIEQAGADALELNIYFLPTDFEEPGQVVEDRCLRIVRDVKQAVTIPVAIKLSPFYSSFAEFARRLDEAGADGLVIFNRFYQPDIDVDQLEIVPNLQLSTSAELRLRLRWLAILSERVRASLAATGGAHSSSDVIKAVLAGAHAVQMVSAILRRGPEHVRQVLDGVVAWMEEQEYSSVRQMQGSMNLRRSPNPDGIERANYFQVLHSWGG